MSDSGNRTTRFWLGFALGFASLVALARPSFTLGDGSGSDDRGDFNYRWLRVRIGYAVELHWWPES